MGVAARSAYMRERRLAAAEPELQDYRVENAGWNLHLPEEEGIRVPVRRVREERDVETEDPFLVLGKMMKEAGKGIWKHVAAPRDKSKLKSSEDKKESDVVVHDPEKGGLAQGGTTQDGERRAFPCFLYRSQLNDSSTLQNEADLIGRVCTKRSNCYPGLDLAVQPGRREQRLRDLYNYFKITFPHALRDFCTWKFLSTSVSRNVF
jgi:hypothetical protein